MAVRRSTRKKAALKFKAWSFSRLSDYERCAFMAYCKNLDPNKPKFKPNKAMLRGTEIHTKCEKYSTKQINKLPEELEPFKEDFAALRERSKDLMVEEELALNEDWEETGWFDPDAWLRVKMDCMYRDGANCMVMIDYKTGRIRPEHEAQLDLYAAAGFALYPEIDVIDSSLWYIDQCEIVAKDYSRAEYGKLRNNWMKRTKKMLSDTKFEPNPGDACRWCDFAKDKGGPCRY